MQRTRTHRLVAWFLFVMAGTAPVFGQTLDTFNAMPSGAIYSLAFQPDGQVLVGGGFTNLAGQACNRLGRFKADGTLDTSFNPNPGGAIFAVAVQTNGAIVVGGSFNTLGGQPHSNIGRINPDGSVDAGFNPVVSNTVSSLAMQSDGKIIVGGGWTGINGTTRRALARLEVNGTLDTSFNPAPNGAIYACAVQADGQILAGGLFTSLGGQSANHIGRLNTDGSYDWSFSCSADFEVYCLALQPDSKILAGGRFTSLGGTSCNHVGRLNTDGSIDNTFDPGADYTVLSLSLQADGKILVGGAFTNLVGAPLNRLGRLDGSGTLDATFSAPVNAAGGGAVYALAIQPDGEILVGGSFTNVAGQTRSNLARLINTEPAVQNLAYDGYSITWSRSGTAPEFWRTTFAASTNGTDWISLGEGAVIPGGWQLSGFSLLEAASIRARGFVTGGRYNSSSSFLDSFSGPPVIEAQPAGRTNNAGTTAYLSARAVGAETLGYQWWKDGVALSDSASVSGSRTPTLTLSNVDGRTRGEYWMVVTNLSGTATSAVAVLSVLDPFIVSPPASQWANKGDSITLSVAAAGTPPLGYQWRRNGVNLGSATASTLVLANLQRQDIGAYDAVVTNRYGSAVSLPAILSINLATCDSFKPESIYPVLALAMQVDGRIFFGTTVSDFYQMHNIFGRLNGDGTADTNYNVAVSGVQFSTYIQSLAVQPDGNLLVGGDYIWIGSQSRHGFARVSPAGAVDSAFRPGPFGFYPFVSGLGLQPDQKIVVAGCFEQLGWLSQTNVGRIDTAGALDVGFQAGTEIADYPDRGRIYALALQPDGKVVLGGIFGKLCGQARSRIGRLKADGTLDTAFNPGASGSVAALAIQPDGAILVGGSFTNIGGHARSCLARLQADGSVDESFNPAAGGGVQTIVLQADGRILVGGSFTNLAGQPCNQVGRLNADGSMDGTFNPGADGTVSALALQADGNILVGGYFQTLNGQARTGLGRLKNPDPATQTLTRQDSTVTWLRGGSSPEVWRTTFEVSTDGTNWADLGAGARIAGGWVCTDVTSPTNASIRARGFVTGGQGNGSTWFVESTWPQIPTDRLAIVLDDGAFGFRTNHFGFSVRTQPAQAVVIEASTNLVNWIRILTNCASGLGQLLFSDYRSTAFRRRFYRASLYQGSLPGPGILWDNGQLGFAAGRFGFDVRGVYGQNIVIEGSTNLVDWTSLATNTADFLPFHFIDLSSTASSRRFYRTRAQ